MISTAIATIAGSIALLASPVMAMNDEGTADDANAQIQACVTDDVDETYYDSQACIKEVVFNNRFDNTITECEFEDSMNCIWMRVDGFGATFVDVDGIPYYLRTEMRNV